MNGQSSRDEKSVRCVLEGVPRVEFFKGGPRSPEDDPFPSCVRAFLEYRGEDLGFSRERGENELWHEVHIFMMGASGSAFRQMWDTRKWNMGANSILAMAPDPREPFRRALETAGYGCDVLFRKDMAADLGVPAAADDSEAAFRQRIMDSIAEKGRPVIAIGVVGPPEPCIITGYDECGDVLIGWSCFQDDQGFAKGVEFEKSGYFRKKDWYRDTQALILIGDKQSRPSNREIAREALDYGLELMRTPEVRGVKSGQAAYTAWADTLLKGEPFSTERMAELRERNEIHHMTAGTLAEARAWGANFLRQLGDRVPEAREELISAAKCFDDEHDLVWAIWEFTSGMNATDEGARKLADAGTRGRIVPLIRLARTRDMEAANHIEKALEFIGGRMGEAKPATPGAYGKAVLEGVPRAGYDVHLCPFPGSLCAVMEYLGETVDYDFVMGVSGAAFRRFFQKDDGGNVDLMYLAPEPHRRAFGAIGYEVREVMPDRAKMLEAIRESIAKGRPALAFGIIGPPECGIVTGYDRGGEVLRGWSYFQDRSQPGYYEKSDWFESMDKSGSYGLLVVGDKERWPGPSKRDVLLSSLRWAIDLERAPKRACAPGHVSGLAAYDAWADALEVDADYPQDDAKVMETRVMVHCDQCVMLEERKNGASYLRKMAQYAPEAEAQLKAAADLYDEAARQGEMLWPSGGNMDPQTQQWLADPGTRREVAATVRAAKAKEVQAVEHLEKALAAMEAGGERP